MLPVLKHALKCANKILLCNAQVFIYLQSHSLTLRQSLGLHIQIYLLAFAPCTYLASSNT